LEPGPWKVLRWLRNENGSPIDETTLPTGARLAFDAADKPVILFQEQWSCDFFSQRNPRIQLSALPIEAGEQEPEAAAALV
jgi:peptide subunit release factor RF-3